MTTVTVYCDTKTCEYWKDGECDKPSSIHIGSVGCGDLEEEDMVCPNREWKEVGEKDEDSEKVE